ncbi:hypothetical protein F511_42977 [Dorcoceras hygrometricum]|uniref:Uncharacterized protein n=1 Tax=Dorcoceras hygrometricum TaxID=472368 RepID=A0A2Z7BEV3_9LAMI|nr:hypothetical protein F511_42977 [Dorcoceras hygrometricum]
MVRKYYRSAVGLVFMEWAAGLAMETSKVESAVRNQAEAKLKQVLGTKKTISSSYICPADGSQILSISSWLGVHGMRS